MVFLRPVSNCTTFSDYAHEYLVALHGGSCSHFETTIHELRGGLDSFGVARVRTRFESQGVRRSTTVLVKKTRTDSPEARLHARVFPAAAVRLGPSLLGFSEQNDEHILIFEFVRAVARWPWSDADHSRSVLQGLAELHRKELSVFRNDHTYSSALTAVTLRLLQLFETAETGSPLAFTRTHKRLVQRLADRLPAIRRELLDNSTFRATLIHGDVHSGNVLMRRQRSSVTPVFLDWGRSRHGSPLEDVSSWLQSLGFWEPEAKRGHDALLRHYLLCFRGEDKLTDDIRSLYWAAAACNVLAGAAIHHFNVANDKARPPRRRQISLRSLVDCIRVLRRADAYWTTRAI